MKLSEMITALEKYKEQIGDVDVTADVTFNLAEIDATTDPLTERISRLRKSERDREALKAVREKHPKRRIDPKQLEIINKLQQNNTERPGTLSD